MECSSATPNWWSARAAEFDQAVHSFDFGQQLPASQRHETHGPSVVLCKALAGLSSLLPKQPAIVRSTSEYSGILFPTPAGFGLLHQVTSDQSTATCSSIRTETDSPSRVVKTRGWNQQEQAREPESATSTGTSSTTAATTTTTRSQDAGHLRFETVRFWTPEQALDLWQACGAEHCFERSGTPIQQPNNKRSKAIGSFACCLVLKGGRRGPLDYPTGILVRGRFPWLKTRLRLEPKKEGVES